MSYTVTVYPERTQGAQDGVTAHDIDYVSFVSSPGGEHPGTYGKPPLMTPGDPNFDAEEELRVAYINPANISLVVLAYTPDED
jgi:hypothetical protein